MRYFTLVDYPNKGDTYGKYIGKTPKAAASKFFTFLSRKHNLSNNENKFLRLTIRDIDSGQIYIYIGQRVRYNKPLSIFINGKKINFNYKNILTLSCDGIF